MNKFSLSQSSVDTTYGKLLYSLATTSIVLITFNIGWQVMFLKLYTHLAIIQSLDRTVINFEFWLLMGNSSILMLFYCLWLGDKKLNRNL